MVTSIGRAVGKYQNPAVVMDNSWLVDYGQHRAGAASVHLQVSGSLLNSGVQEQDSYERVVLKTSVDEYGRLFYKGVIGDNGIPKASYAILNELNPVDFPEELLGMINLTKTHWRATSRKARKIGKISVADLELLTYVREQAVNGRECFVLTYDEDETSPIKDLASRHPNIHLGEETGQPADLLALSVAGNSDHPIFVKPTVLGGLYALKAGQDPTHYMLASRTPYIDGTTEFGIALHPIEHRIRTAEEDAVRYPIIVLDIERLIDSGGTSNAARMKDQVISKYKTASKRFLRQYPVGEHITLVKSRRHGFLEMIRKRTSKDTERTYDENSQLNWVTMGYDYLRRFSPETLKFIEDFERKFQK